ncbi:MAG: PAS domain S-box protein, partial [Candidatus Hodarchaeota archaeon]
DLLRKERENFYNILNTINDLIYIVNAGFEIEFVNAALEEEYDKSAVGNKCYKYFNGFDEPCPWCTMKEVLEGETVRWEKTRERNQRTYDIIDTPLRNSDGSISLLSILRNITERKQTEEALRESELKFRTFIETLPQPVWIYQDYQCRYANPAAEKVTGFSMEDLSSMHFWDFLHPDYKEIAINGGKALEKGLSPPVSDAIVKIITKSGNEKWLDARLEVIDFEGKRATLITAMDITRRKEAEEALRESETKYRTLVERANDGIAIVEGGKLGDKFKFVNQRFAQMLGYKPEELLKMSYAQAVHPDVFPEINERRKARLAGKEVSLTYDSKLIRKDGSPLEVGLNLGVIDYQGEDAVLAIVRDITERKKVEQALKENEEKYRSFIENFQGIAFKGYADYSQEFFLGKVEEITGYPESDFLSGKIIFKDLIYPGDSERIAQDVLEFYSSSKESHRREYRIKDRYGAIHWLQEDIKKFCNKEVNTVGVYGTIQDITKRKRAEEALRKSEEKYRLLFELAPIGIGISNFKGCILEANQKILEIMGYTLDEAKTINLANTYVNPEDREKLIKRLQVERQVQDYELELKRKDGTPYYSLLNISHMELGDQEVYLTTQRDLTEWKEMDRAKRETEERLRKFMESATDGFTLLDSNLNFIDINKAGLTGLGSSREEVIGKNFLEIFPKLRDSDTYEKYLEVLKTGNPYYIDDIDSAPLIRQKYYSVRAFKVGNGLGILTTDISNRVKAEKTKEELEKQRDSFVWMTSHELRTPLTVLTGYCDFLMEHINDLAQQRITNILGVMKSNLDRLERLTSKVSTIGQIERGIFEIEKTSINFCNFLQDTLEPYHQLLGNQFESRGCLEETSIIIDGDPHRLQQVIDNIIGNAIKQTDKDHRKIKIQTKISPSNIKIEVTDNGAGIEAENLNVIFDQFVSIPTEFSATGTGIGLYLCQKTLEAHGGRITAKSKGPGRGATFTIELPRTNTNDSREF